MTIVDVLNALVECYFHICVISDAKRKVIVGEECVINVDKSRAGPGNVTARIRSPSGQPADIDIEDNNDGTVSVYYTPRHPGVCSFLPLEEAG